MNQPWECPRCKRMNAPFTPSCFCSPDNKSDHLEDSFSYLNGPKIVQYIKESKCTNCNGHHGIYQGRAIQCVNL